jgi:hypothetical protein
MSLFSFIKSEKGGQNRSCLGGGRVGISGRGKIWEKGVGG